MAKKLEELGAAKLKSNFGVKRAPTSVIALADWPENEIDPDEDAEKFLDQAVVYDIEHGPYNLTMTKVDVKMGGYSENLFYVMQILHQKNRDVFILFTRWGRIGEIGMFQ